MSRAPLFVAVASIAAGLLAPHVLPNAETAQVQMESPYPDVDAFSLEGKASAYLWERNIMIGLPNGTFGGDQAVNRAQAAKILLIAGQKKVLNMRNVGIFTDVPDGQWYTQYVLSAGIHEIISGYQDRSFRPANTINTVEFLKMLSLTFNLPAFTPHDYLDVSPSDWFNRYAGIAQTYDLFPLKDRRMLSPGSPITRREAAIAIYQYLRISGKGPSPLITAASRSSARSSSVASFAQSVASSSAVAASAASSEDAPVLRRSSSSSIKPGCYFPPTPPSACLYVCEKNVLCLKEEQCMLMCSASSAGA
jgi:hypothetical protein